MRSVVFLLATIATNPAIAAPAIPPAIYTDPVHDAAHPARMEVLHIPSGNVQINGVAYLAAGPGLHPTIIICHGLPGNEKNLDLAQAIRRAGWNAVTFNYRGSWGSPGSFQFSQNPEDAAAVLAYIRNPANAKALGIDPSRIVLAGHSMGGWVAAKTAARDTQLAGTILISAANLGMVGRQSRPDVIKTMAGNMEALAGTTPEALADEVVTNADTNDFVRTSAPLAQKPLLVLSSNDGLAPHTDALITAIRNKGGKYVTAIYVATDHG